MISEYIRNGNVAKNRIALDIKYRKLKCADIEELVADTKIQEAFIGTSYDNKKPKSEWDKNYLDLLSYAAISESFNRDYLLYLDVVAEHVMKTKKKTIFLAGIIFLAIIIVVAGIVYISTIKSSTPEATGSMSREVIKKAFEELL
jgi:hypothetical protein